MSTVPSKPWADFPVAFTIEGAGYDDKCRNLIEVTHVAHVSDALRIIEDKRIRSSLVYDESCLNTKRTCVSWVSPKTWTGGYIYGNVAFVFDWKEIVKKKKIYWVEYKHTENQDICRFLISDANLQYQQITEYDCTEPDGPLYWDLGCEKWYHNNSVTCEFMILSDLPLSDCKSIRLVNHHSQYCNKAKKLCPDLGRDENNAGGEVICRLIGSDQRLDFNLFRSSDTSEISPALHGPICSLRDRIVHLFNTSFQGSSLAFDQTKLMKAVLLALSFNQEDVAGSLLKLFPDQDAVRTSFFDCLDAYFKPLKVVGK